MLRRSLLAALFSFVAAHVGSQLLSTTTAPINTGGSFVAYDDESTGKTADNLHRGDFASMVRANGADKASIADAVAKLKANLNVNTRALLLWYANHQIFNSSPTSDPLDFADGVSAAAKDALAIAKACPAIHFEIEDNEDGPCAWNVTGVRLAKICDRYGLKAPNAFDEPSIVAFNNLCASIVTPARRAGFHAAFRKYQKNALLSTFGDFVADDADALLDQNGHQIRNAFGIAGSVQSPALYGSKGLNRATTQPYSLTQYSVDILHKVQRHGSQVPWVGGPNVDGNGGWGGDAYWSEFIRHSLLTAGPNLLIFNAGQPGVTEKIAAIVDEVYAAEHGKWLPYPMLLESADGSYIASGRCDDPLYPTAWAVRVTMPAGAMSVQLPIFGKVYTAKPDAGGVGCWIVSSNN